MKVAISTFRLPTTTIMHRTYISLAVVAGLSLWGCGPSAEETESRLLQDIANKQHLESELDSTKSAIIAAKQTVLDLIARIEVERVRLGRIEDWQLGRSIEQRDAQITEQVKLMQQLESSLKEWEAHQASLIEHKRTLESVLSQYADVDRKMDQSGVK